MYFCFGDLGPTWKEATEAAITEDDDTIVSQVRFVICTRFVKASAINAAVIGSSTQL